ncbi:Fer8 [Coprinopsis cinerea okayama7|uniref:Fer8 n=1 Tax=Coprinopsis cinerea (strain Okayama-7 / 130 / ATCC MYA-4618 / FGSC 9003) TaxID=240176 RepID=A8P230_COPC7|nr:Fer8 [Coprinopsis cinerea okayama7\|eukprot:XP_001838231.2 Fer8 [Coprinopsis cinerea okayama7\
MGGGVAPTSETKTVVVLGVAYGDVYVMPRYAVLPGHEYKAFIPYTNVFLTPGKNPNHIVLKAQVLSIRPNHVTLSQAFPEHGFPTTTIPFDYAVYALGGSLAAPLDLWGSDPRTSLSSVKGEDLKKWEYNGFKSEGIEWFRERQKVVEKAPTVLVVGGGALGIRTSPLSLRIPIPDTNRHLEFATDIKAVYPDKKVTLLHSRQQLLPKFDEALHHEVRKTLESQEVELILGERLDLDSVDHVLGAGKVVNAKGQRVVRTVTGREISADLLLLCVGQKPNSGLIEAMDPSTVSPSTKLVRVYRTMQISTEPVNEVESDLASEVKDKLKVSEESSTPSSESTTSESKKTPAYPHIFAIGDVADAFGAIAAGHNAYAQGEVAARNIIRLIKRSEAKAGGNKEEEEALEQYTAGPPAIKVSLGLRHSVYQLGDLTGTKDDGEDDLQAGAIWPLYGIKVEKDEDMLP